MREFILTCLVLISTSAQARVFNFDEKIYSTYLRGSFATTRLGDSAFQGGFPSAVSFSGSQTASTAFSAELGFAYTYNHDYRLRLGVEVFYPPELTQPQGKDGSGNPLFNVDSQLISVIPQVNLEAFLKRTPETRIYIGGGAGYAVTSIKNSVTLTTQGSSAYPGVSAYSEQANSWDIMGQGFLGYEFIAFDNVSLSFDGGYRYFFANNYKATASYTSAVGSYQSGDQIKNADGTNRSTNMSGFFASAMFRFYIQ